MNLGEFFKAFHHFGGRLLWKIVNDKLKIVGIVMLKKYRIGFDIFVLLLFLLIMIPNFIWFTVLVPNDIL